MRTTLQCILNIAKSLGRPSAACQYLHTLPVAGSGTAPLRPMVTLGTGFDSDKLVRICAPPSASSGLVDRHTAQSHIMPQRSAAQEQGPSLG